jgi:hypothetical protein
MQWSLFHHKSGCHLRIRLVGITTTTTAGLFVVSMRLPAAWTKVCCAGGWVDCTRVEGAVKGGAGMNKNHGASLGCIGYGWSKCADLQIVSTGRNREAGGGGKFLSRGFLLRSIRFFP